MPVTPRIGGLLDEPRRIDASIVALVPFVVLAVLHWSVPPSVASGDWAHYLLHAKALVEGRPYGDTGYIYSPLNPFVGPRQQPPGLPLVLAPLVAIGGVHSPLIKLLSLLSAGAFLWLAARVLSRAGSTWIAAGAVLMTGIALEASFATAAIGSDLGFCALTWIVITCIDTEGPLTTRRLLIATLAGALAMSYRLAGLALIPALMLYAVMNWRTTKVRPLLPVAIWSALAALTIAVTGLPDYIDLRDLWRRVDVTIMTPAVDAYKVAYFGSTLYPFASNRANDIYHLCAGVLAVVGVISLARAWYRRFVAAFIVSYVLMLLVVDVWEARYMWVLYPIMAYVTLSGLAIGIGKLWPRVSKARPGVIALAAAAFVGIAASVQLLRIPTRPGLLGTRDVEALFTVLREGREGKRVAWTNPRVLTLETGVPAMMLLVRSDSVAIAELRRRRITHVITDTLKIQPRASDFFEDLANRRPELFRVEYRNPTFTLYRLEWTAYDAATSSRDSLDRASS
jgi:hypothetical protein